MKEKKNKGARKVLLMAISVVLVAAVSVSVTLAYLTSITAEKDNVFKASGSINGKVIEPNYDEEKAANYLPGVPVTKDPMIDNDSANDYEIYVGARLDFYIELNGIYQQVTYENFAKFVDITGLPTSTSIAVAEDGKWYDITPSTGNDAGSKYYFYNKVLVKNDGDVGAYKDAGDDTTAALFQSVTVKKELTLGSGGAAMTNTDVANGDLTKTYNGFNYKIKITGYGTKNETDTTALSAKDLILAGLKTA